MSEKSNKTWAVTESAWMTIGKMHVDLAVSRVESEMTISILKRAITTTKIKYMSCKIMNR